jgi:hypothetical protein
MPRFLQPALLLPLPTWNLHTYSDDISMRRYNYHMTETPSPFCPYCHSSLPADSLVCPNCNRWLDKTAVMQTKTATGDKQSPINDTLRHNQETLKILIPLMLVLGIICIMVGGVGGFWLFSQQKKASTTKQAEQTEIASLRTATAQAVFTWTAIQAQQATATQAAVATQAALEMKTLRSQTESWELALKSEYTLDDGIWYTGSQEDDLVRGEWSITNGEYLIELEAVDNFAQWMWPDPSGDVSDFYLSTSLLFLEGPETMDGGLIFRLQGYNQYYLYDLYSNGAYSVYLHADNGWEVITEDSTHGLYLPNTTNQLEVIGSGDRFILFLNGSFLFEFTDDTLTHGWVGVLVGLVEAGDQGTWAYDDFILRTPLNQK